MIRAAFRDTRTPYQERAEFYAVRSVVKRARRRAYYLDREHADKARFWIVAEQVARGAALAVNMSALALAVSGLAMLVARACGVPA